MSEVLRALTGPAAAALLDLQGFRELNWPFLWCAPIHVEPMDDLIRTRRWERPAVRGGQIIAAPHLVLRHLNALPVEAYEHGDGLTIRDRVAFATEHALHSKLVDRSDLTFTGGPQNGSHLLREYLEWRGLEPPTESYAETGSSLIFEKGGITSFRQVPIYVNGRIIYRCDFAIPFDSGRWHRRRPHRFPPAKFLLVEIDSRQFHDHDSGFERDHERDLMYRMLGYQYLCFTAHQVQHRPDYVLSVVKSVLQGIGAAA